jgi:hypothetical protein
MNTEEIVGRGRYWVDDKDVARCSIENGNTLFEAVVDSPCAAGPWQPGETAPKDGSLILGKWDVGVGAGRWVRCGAVFFKDGQWKLNIGDWVVCREPEYWAPINLPEEVSDVRSGRVAAGQYGTAGWEQDPGGHQRESRGGVLGTRLRRPRRLAS